jgi:phthiodiolone/phenolphthiodiolone dimycocerosates ketoreductase
MKEAEMKVGLCMPTLYPLSVNDETVDLAETMGFDSLWMPDHLLGNFHPDLWERHGWSDIIPDPDGWFDPFCLSARLSHTTDIPLGVSVTDGLRRRAVDVARSALSLQHMCRGGFHLGVGSGEAENLLPFGYSFDRPVAHFEEFLRELRHILDTGVMPQDTCGRLGLPLESPAGQPKVWVAAHGPRMLRLTGEYGDGWLPAWRMTPEEYAEKRGVVARHAAARGREMPECGMYAAVIVGESRDALLAMMADDPAARSLALWLPGHLWERHGLTHPLGRESLGMVDVILHEFSRDDLLEIAAGVPAEFLALLWFMGNVDELLEVFEGYAKVGLEHLVIGNAIGVTGGVREITAHTPELRRLREKLSVL